MMWITAGENKSHSNTEKWKLVFVCPSISENLSPAIAAQMAIPVPTSSSPEDSRPSNSRSWFSDLVVARSLPETRDWSLLKLQVFKPLSRFSPDFRRVYGRFDSFLQSNTSSFEIPKDRLISNMSRIGFEKLLIFGCSCNWLSSLSFSWIEMWFFFCLDRVLWYFIGADSTIEIRISSVWRCICWKS